MQRHIRKAISVIASVLIICGLLAIIFATVAPFIGLGRKEEFILYKHFSWSRNHVSLLGLYGILAGAGLWLVSVFLLAKVIKALGKIRRYCGAQVRRALSASFGSVLKVMAVNLVLIALLLVVVELIVRIVIPESSVYATSQPGQYFRFQPYLQTSNEGPLDNDGVWHDPLHDENIPFHVRANSLGFRIDRELDTTTRYQKKENERVVLVFGGSSVYGFGNTSNATTSSGYLEKFLNQQSGNGIHYTVFNMGNGGWVSYQELIALDLYGLNLDPDWVIVCDGRNDIYTLAGLTGDDVGFHFSTPQMRDYIDGYLYQQQKPDFFRGNFENKLLEKSAAYRWLSGKRPTPLHAVTRFPSPRGWTEVDRTVDFYLKTERSLLRQCDNCRYILSTQPIYRSGRKKLSEHERAAIKEKYRDIAITISFISDARFEDILMYTYGRIIDEMPALCDELGERCTYIALDTIFPSNDAKKSKYFVDDVHVRDEGNELIARSYADTILAVDAKNALHE